MTSRSLQTILGSSGNIGTALAKEVTSYTSNIRLVSRNPQKINNTDQLFEADLLKAKEVLAAVKGSEIVYLVVGILGLFIPILKEVKELRYQLDRDFCFDSYKIEQAYGLKAIDLEE